MSTILRKEGFVIKCLHCGTVFRYEEHEVYTEVNFFKNAKYVICPNCIKRVKAK